MSFLLSMITMMSMVEVKWLNTDVDVVLNDEISAYVDIPEARLYIDGIYVNTEANYVYNGVNRTFISVINTSYVKTYQLDYEVYFPLYDIKDTKSIYFHVKDDVAPQFMYIPTYEIEVGDKIPDLSLNVTYKDNYDENENLILSIDQSYVNVEQVGTYPIYYHLYDSSHNHVESLSYITVVDRIAPSVSLKKTLELDVGTHRIDPYTYFKINDNVDEQLFISIDDEMVNYDQLGIYDFTVEVIDQSGNETVGNYQIEITDKIEPTLQVSQHATIEVDDHEALNHLDDYIISIYDNYDTLSHLDVMISHDIDIEVIGTYHIDVKVSDQSNNIAEARISIEVVDQVIPSIELKKPLIVEVYGFEPFLLTYFQIEDNYDRFDQLEIDIDAKIDMEHTGSYQVIVTVEDSSKNIAYYYGYMLVVDMEPPTIEVLNDILITNFAPIDYTSYVAFYDNYDEEITHFVFDDQFITYDKVGHYELMVYAYDTSGNEQKSSIDVAVIDIIEPTLTLSTYQIYMSLDDDIDDLAKYIEEAYDNYDALSHHDVYISGQIDNHNIGLYDIEYHLLDQSQNHKIATLSVRVDDDQQPVVNMSDIVIQPYDEINYEAGITIMDDLPCEVYVDKNYIDTSQVGIQYVTYVITDARGNYTSYIRKVIIEEAQLTLDIYQFIPLIIIELIGMTALMIIYKKYR